VATAVIHSAPAAMLRGLDVGVDVASLIAGIRERERRKDALTRQLAELDHRVSGRSRQQRRPSCCRRNWSN